MNLQLKRNTPSLASHFLLLAIVAGVMHIDLFESDIIPAHSDPDTLYHTELYDDKAHISTSTIFYLIEEIQGNGVEANRTHSTLSPYYVSSLAIILRVKDKSGENNTATDHFSCDHFRLFNIPHQNADEDESLA